MTDRRLLAFSGRVADQSLRGKVEAEDYVTPQRMGLLCGQWLHDQPNGAINRELLFGDAFDVIERRGEWAFGRSAKDGYCGWVEINRLGAWHAPTHRIAVRTTWGYAKPDLKIPRSLPIHMASGVHVLSRLGGWAEIAISNGSLWVPGQHLTEVPLDPVDVARAFLGTPYVWAGNSGFGVDCSGLVQLAMHASGLACAPDSDLQSAMPGEHLSESQRFEPGDLIFWRGHVGMATGSEMMIHANAFHMMVVEEPIVVAIARIATTDTGPVTRRLRPERRPMPAI